MRRTRRIEATLHRFHLDRPDDTWDQLVVPLKELAEATLWELISLDDREAKYAAYGDMLEDLQHIAATYPLTSSQVKVVGVGAELLKAAQERLDKGDPEPLANLIDRLTKETEEVRSVAVPVSTAVPQPTDTDGVTFSRLAELYMAEQSGRMRPGSVINYNSSIKTLTAALTDHEGVELNLKRHNREDMVRLRASLSGGRKQSTVNKLLTRLDLILTWAVNTGHLEKTYNKGLTNAKGAESGRKAFTEEQLTKLMAEMNQLPEDSWRRWAMSIGVITGARIGEVHQLTKADIRKVGDVTVVDLNENEGKVLKNKHSNRLVPLVDGALGFDLEAFLRYVETCENKLFDDPYNNFTRVLNKALRDVLGFEVGEGQSYHSLRHSMASRLKRQGVPVGIAQDILGHSSQTITFDLYGGDQRLSLDKLVAALRESFGLGIAE